jgi:hypothetical protein
MEAEMDHRWRPASKTAQSLLPAFFALSVTLLSQQTPPPKPGVPASANPLTDSAPEGTAAVSGVVTDESTKQPIPGVMVYLGFQGRGAVGRLSRQISDDKGRFVFTDLAAGNLYFINTSKPGYLEGHFGTGAGGQLGGLITLADGQWFSQANVVMARLGSINGVVVDEHGEPAAGIFVRVLTEASIGGRVRLMAGQTSKTDDRGVYRLAELLPGKYRMQVPFIHQTLSLTLTAADLAGLTASQLASGRTAPELPLGIDSANTRLIVGAFAPPPSPVDGRPQTYLSLFYPGVASIGDATTIDLGPGEQREGINFALRAVAATSISGVVDGPPESLPGLIMRLLPDGLEEAGGTFETATATLGSDGRFAFVNVPSGSYTIDVRRSVSELVVRPPLSTSSLPLPATPGMASGGSGSIPGGPDGASYAYRTSRAAGSYFARQKVTVGSSALTNLVVPLKRASTIRGRFVLNAGESPTPGPTLVSPVYAESADANSAFGLFPSLPNPVAPQGSTAQSLTFEIPGLAGSAYRLRFLSVPWNGAVMSILGDDGVDYRTKLFDTSSGRDFDVVVTITSRRIDLAGTAADEQGAQIKNAVVIAFPVQREQWTNYGMSPVMRGSPTNSTGTYRFQSLAAGEYYLLGVPPDQANIWQDPAKLAIMAPLATRVTLAWGDTKIQNVPVVRIK